MSQKLPPSQVPPATRPEPVAEAQSERPRPRLPRASDAPPRAPGEKRESRFIRGRSREEREAARAEAEAEAVRTGVPVPPRRAFIRDRTPEEIDADRIEADQTAAEEEASLGSAAFIWRPKKEFPAFLRKVREEAKIPLRQAAPALGMSAAYLSRLETGGPARQPSLERLNKMAALYNVDRHTMYEAAGVHVGLPEDYDLLDYTDDEFEALMLDPALQPGMMTHEALNYFSPRMKRQVIEFATSLVAQADPAAYLNNLLRQVRGIE